jgi:hypothetical protein
LEYLPIDVVSILYVTFISWINSIFGDLSLMGCDTVTGCVLAHISEDGSFFPFSANIPTSRFELLNTEDEDSMIL